MKSITLFFGLLAAPTLLALEFTGNPLPAVEISPEASSGLEAVYVLENTAGVKASYTATGSGTPVWFRFSRLGGSFAEPVASTTDGRQSYITLASGDMGYIVEDGGRRHCFWIVDYSGHRLELGALSPSAEKDCGRQLLDFTGSADEIPFYSINGRRIVLSRDLKLEYTTLTFDEAAFAYNTTEATETLASIDHLVSVPAPLTITTFRLTGDRFMQAWNNLQSIESPAVQPYAAEANTRATQDSRDNDNEQKEGNEGLGGSAPCDITFEAVTGDAAVFHEWQISRSAEFDINELTYTDLEFTYTFREQGTTYVRFIAANADGSCEYVSPTYEIFIGESKLEIPNAFSPQSSPGVNDEWKVSYKSLVSYECHIFNRWGTQLFSSTDPAAGWDGKYGGKFVPAGVYYYVIQAEGADGIKYKRAGDINIVGYSENTIGGESQEP